MTEFARSRSAVDDTDLLCVEVSGLGAGSSTLPRVSCGGGWHQFPSTLARTISSTDHTQEDFLSSLLLKTDAYRPRQQSLKRMQDTDFLVMRKAVVDWFAKVSVSYDFANETVVAALSNFDRYVSVTLEPVNNHLLLQLAAYVALLVASKMSETVPLRMKSLANLTGRMFTPLQVQQCEMDMISKLHFRLAPPSADETLQCLSTLLHNSEASNIPVADLLSTSSCYLKKARARTCWFRHSPYTLAVAALATAYNSLGLGQLRRSLLRECDARARSVTGRGVDLHGVAACSDAMSMDERAAAAALASTRSERRGTDSPVCNKAAKEGWGSPTGVAQGAELLQEVAFLAVRGVPLVAEFSPSPPKAFSPCAMPKASRVVRRACRRGLCSSRVPSPSPAVPLPPRQGHKRGLHQSFGSCFVPCPRRSREDGEAGKRRRVQAGGEVRVQEAMANGVVETEA